MLGTHGDLRVVVRNYSQGRLLVERVGDAAWIAWYRAELLLELYWRGRWNEALTLASTSSPARRLRTRRQASEFDASLVRARIELARGDTEAAIANVRHAVAFARGAPDPQNLYPRSPSPRGRALAVGDDDRGRSACSTSCSSERPTRPSPPSFWVVDLALAAIRARTRPGGRSTAFATRAWRTRWLEAAHAIVGRRPRRGSRVCAERSARCRKRRTCGSRPRRRIAPRAAGLMVTARGAHSRSTEQSERLRMRGPPSCSSVASRSAPPPPAPSRPC